MGFQLFSLRVDNEFFFGTFKKPMKSEVQVGGAAFFGSFLPATNLFLGDAEPIFRVLALAGQFAVAVVTVVYIWTKIRALKRK